MATVTASAVFEVDDGWGPTSSQTSDCVEGWGDDEWEFTNTAFGYLTVTVADCCVIGDYYEIWVDGVLVGTTPDPGYPGGSSLSVGSVTVWLAPGTHTIEIRDALDFITYPTMCPAGYDVTGEWEAIVEFTKELTDEIEAGDGDGDGVLETGEDWMFEMTITLTNVSGEDIEGIRLHDRLGGDLEWHAVGWNFGSDLDISYKGKTEKVFLDWYDGFTLAHGDSAIITMLVSPDVNTGNGNGKEAEGNQEFTSSGEHCLNSGAWFEGWIGDEYIEACTNPVCVDVEDAD